MVHPSQRPGTSGESDSSRKWQTRITLCAELFRPDVKSSLGVTDYCGFSFDLAEIADEIGESSVCLTIQHMESGFDFYGRDINYCNGATRHYEVIKTIFFPEFYRCNNSLHHISNDEAFQEYITNGLCAERDPNPWFSNRFYRENYPNRLKDGEVPLVCYLDTESERKESPSRILNINTYEEQNPDLKGMQSLLMHYSVHGNLEGRAGVTLSVPEAISEELLEIAEIDPKVGTATPHLKNVVRYPQITRATYLPTILSERYGDDIKVVICVPFISRGGADLISTFLFRAYQNVYGKKHVLLMVTDRGEIDVPEWIDEGSQVVSFVDESKFVDSAEQLLTLNICLGQLAPEKIVNVNSHLLWQVMDLYSVQLSSVADLYAYLFCFDYDKNRNRVGYITDYLPSTLKSMKAVYFDNKKIVEDIKTIYGVTEAEAAKLHPIYVPAAEGLTATDLSNDSDRNRILWIGRLSIQKRPDLLVEIAQSMPGYQFDVYGPPGNSEVSDKIVSGQYKNINYVGVYNSLDEVNYLKYSAFLNTSEWDGLPTILIQMMAIGLPIVTSSVCGITELVTDETGWLVDQFDCAQEYVIAIQSALIQRDEARRRVATGLRHVAEVHSALSFNENLAKHDAFVDHASTPRVGARFKDRRRRSA